jgi:hypothetical protein
MPITVIDDFLLIVWSSNAPLTIRYKINISYRYSYVFHYLKVEYSLFCIQIFYTMFLSFPDAIISPLIGCPTSFHKP